MSTKMHQDPLSETGWSVRELSFGYPGSSRLFSWLDIAIPASEIVLLSGDNGRGKSTLLKLLTGELKPGRGSISFDGKAVDTEDFGTRLYYLPQNPAQALVGITGRDDLNIWKLSFRDRDKLVLLDGIIAEPYLQPLIDKPFTKLSTGELRTMATAILPCLTDRFWLIDEPFAGLDNTASDRLISLLVSRQEAGLPGAIIVDHSGLAAGKLAHRVIDLDDL